MPPSFDGLFSRLLRDAAAATGRGDEPLYPFWPRAGRAYRPGGLLVVGRATNGGPDGAGHPALAADSDEGAAKLASLARRLAEEEREGPNSWIARDWRKTGSYARRSQFWRVIRAVVRALEPAARDAGDDWPHHVAWTNLYRLAPHGGGNPPAWLWRAQDPTRAELLAAEVAAFDPGRVLVLAGDSWYRGSTDPLTLRTIASPGRLVEQVAQQDGRRWVLAKHPQGKAEGRFVEEVLRAFRLPA